MDWRPGIVLIKLKSHNLHSTPSNLSQNYFNYTSQLLSLISQPPLETGPSQSSQQTYSLGNINVSAAVLLYWSLYDLQSVALLRGSEKRRKPASDLREIDDAKVLCSSALFPQHNIPNVVGIDLQAGQAADYLCLIYLF